MIFNRAELDTKYLKRPNKVGDVSNIVTIVLPFPFSLRKKWFFPIITLLLVGLGLFLSWGGETMVRLGMEDLADVITSHFLREKEKRLRCPRQINEFLRITNSAP